MGPCQFCNRFHRSCTRDECYCGDGPVAVRGEGYNETCFEHWTGKEAI